MNLNEFILNHFHDKKLNFYVGAGISFNSDVPVVWKVIESICDNLGIEKDSRELLHSSNIPFESFIQISYMLGNLDVFLDTFLEGQPNTNHLLLAKLAKEGITEKIYTTNFDLLIEQAFDQIQSSYNKYIKEEDFSFISNSDNSCSLVKLHGCASDKATIRTTINQVAKKQFVKERHEAIKEFFDAKDESPIIIMGYSFSDKFDLQEAISKYSKGKENVYIVQHSDHFKVEKIESSNLKFLNKCKGYIIYTNTDEFVKGIHNLYFKDYKFLSSKIKNKNWILKSLAHLADHAKLNIAGLLFSQISAHKLAFQYFEKALKELSTLETKNHQAIFSVKCNLAMSYDKLGDHKMAESIFLNLKEYLEKHSALSIPKNYFFCYSGLAIQSYNKGLLEESITLLEKCLSHARELEDHDKIIVTLNNLGNSLSDKEENELAIKSFKELRAYSQKTGDLPGIIQARIGLARVFSNINKAVDANTELDEAIRLSNEIGYLELEEIASANKGILLIDHFEKYVEGIQLLKHSLALIAQTNQSNNLAYIHQGLAGGNLGLNQIQEAKTHLDIAIDIFEEGNDLISLVYCLSFKIRILIDYDKDYSAANTLCLNTLKLVKTNAVEIDLYSLRNLIYNTSLTFYLLKKYNPALEYIQEALLLDKKLGDDENLNADTILMGRIKYEA